MKHILHYNNNRSLSYNDYGNPNGFPILLQHGLIASINDEELFESLIDLGARLISIARPGYGESTPYLLNSFAEWGAIVSVLVDRLNLTRFDVFGASSGAPYCYAIGYKIPDRARRIYILSGIPALYDEQILSAWPHPVSKNAGIVEMQTLGRQLFFSNLSPSDLDTDDIKDSLMNDCFGVAQDLRLRGLDWGFRLSDLKQTVTMQHSRFDPGVPFVTAEMTARLIPNCKFIINESDVHFSKELLSEFIRSEMAFYL